MSTRTIRFVGGPLHGESRDVDDSRSRFAVPLLAAGALKHALAGTEAASPAGADDLVYVRRGDGRYWLEVDTPAGIEEDVPGFKSRWYDTGEGLLLCEVDAPHSDWGHAQADVSISEELLSDPVEFRKAGGVMAFVIENIRHRERRIARRVSATDVLSVAAGIEVGEEIRRGNRRIVAAWLRLYLEERRNT